MFDHRRPEMSVKNHFTVRTIWNNLSQRNIPRWAVQVVAFVIVLAITFIFSKTAHCASYLVAVNAQCPNVSVTGDQVAVIMETQTHPPRLPDQRMSVSNLKGYLVTAKLNTGTNPNSTLAVIGPLYEVQGSFSNLANSAGATFDKNDRQQLSKKPFFAFREKGVLVKSDIIDNETKWHDWELQIIGTHVSWRDLGTRPILPLRGGFDPNYLESQSRRYAVQFLGAHNVRVFDKYRSESISNDWLPRVCSDYLAQEDLGNCRATLLDDLNTLVVIPSPVVQVQRNGKEVSLDEFELNDKKYARKNHLLVYERPNFAPKVYEFKDADYHLTPIRLDNTVMLLTAPDVIPGGNSSDKISGVDYILKLADCNQHTAYSRQIADNEFPIGQFSHVEGNQVIFRDGPIFVSDPPDPQFDRIIVSKWDVKQNTLTQFNMHVSDLFELKDDGYYPKKLIHIDIPK